MEYRESTWEGFKRLDFQFEDRDALIVLPDCDKNGKWMVKMEYFGAFPNLEIELLHRGWHLAYLKNHNRWGTDDDSDAKARFAEFISKEFGLDSKFTCVGMSCGGICSVNMAYRHPECVSFLYLDAPVMNLLSCPMGFGIGNSLGENGSAYQEIVDAYGFDLPSLLLYREHPVDKVPAVAASGIPAAIIYGDSDPVVPYVENGIVMEKYYREKGLPLFCVGKPGCGHHPHGLEDPKPLADFIEKYSL